MSLVPCPGCGMPRTAEDLAARPCPLCGGDPAPADLPPLAPSVAVPVAPSVVPAPPARDFRRLWLLLAALLPMAVGAGVYALWPTPTPDPEPDASPQQYQPVAEALKPSPAKPPAEVAKRETAPAPRVASAEEPPKPVAVVPPPAPVEPDPPAEGAVVLNKPNGEYVVPQATGDDAIILTGEVGVLKIGRVSGRALVDTTKLKVKTIIVTDRVDEEGEVRLRATERIEFRERIDGAGKASAESPTGTVHFAPEARIDGSAKVTVSAARAEFVGKVDGGSQLAVTAGAVRFGAENGDGCVAGGARVTVTAKELDIRCPLIGGANVAVTVAASGRIAHKDLEGGAKLTYRKAAASDPEPTVSGGEVRGGATVTQEK